MAEEKKVDKPKNKGHKNLKPREKGDPPLPGAGRPPGAIGFNTIIRKYLNVTTRRSEILKYIQKSIDESNDGSNSKDGDDIVVDTVIYGKTLKISKSELMILKLIDDAAGISEDGEDPTIRLKALSMILDRVEGKPKSSDELVVTNEDSSFMKLPLEVRLDIIKKIDSYND